MCFAVDKCKKEKNNKKKQENCLSTNIDVYAKCLDFVKQYDKWCQCDGNVVQYIWDTQDYKTLLFLYYGRLKLWT